MAGLADGRRSHNGRALARKAITYQKRQLFTNICCIALCPFFMVIVSAGLGALIQTLINRSTTNEGLNDDGYPIYNYTDPRIKDNNLNYIQVLSFDGISGNPGAATLAGNHPCVYWFGDEYPQFSKDIYEKNANLPASGKIDSTFIPPPNNGWLLTLAKQMTSQVPDALELREFTQFQLGTWALTAASSPAMAAVLGDRPKSTPYNITDVNDKLAASLLYRNISATKDATGGFGILGALPQRLYVNLSVTNNLTYNFDGLNPIPYYVQLPTTTDADIDDALTANIQELLVALAGLDKTVLTKNKPTQQEIQRFYLQAGKVTSVMPYGAVYLDQLDLTKLYSRFILHFGSDKRLEASANFPFTGTRLLTQLAQLNTAMAKAITQGATIITQGVRAFPETHNTLIDLQFGGIIGRVLYPFGVSFLLPIFVIILVKEKEDRIFVMMKMNGLKAWAYYLSHYVTFYVLYAVSSLIFLIVGRGSRLTFLTLTEGAGLGLLFFIWGHVQIVLAFFFASIFSKNRIALVLTFLVVLVGVIISLVTDNLFAKAQAPAAFFIWPPFAFYRAMSLINVASYSKTKRPYNLSMLKNSEVGTAINFLIVEIFVYGALALYMAAVVPSEFGTRRPWHFPVTDLIKYFKAQQRKKKNDGVDPLSEAHLALQTVDSDETKFEDDDVRAERARVDAGNYPPNSPLILSHMRKVYGGRGGLGPKIAVKDVTLAAEPGLVFGLLGPNGAGKTTLISILTGLYEASAGDAVLAGYNIKTDLSEVYKVIGICPQFDILWEDLTVEEHLYFYARLKGVERKDEKRAVDDSLGKVSLQSLRYRLTKRLSGGEKRRLSIAIALVGDPAVVFLDEPTTGLDPEVRRLIWNIIQDAREGKTIILTTHSMEEAEALCQRIGIMAKGTLRCLGNPLRLKELYGSGFKLFFNSLEEDTERGSKFIESLLPEGWRKVDAFATNTSYEFPSKPGVISYLFEAVEKGKSANGILDWGISQTTLE
ncbi:hypothetical protein HDU76_003506, partial [Blyttiomyces sp. JEL0837]